MENLRIIVHKTGPFEPDFNNNNTVVDDGCMARRAYAKAQIALVDQHAHLAGEFARVVGDHANVLLALICHLLVHDKPVIDRHAVDRIDALGSQISKSDFKTPKLVDRASGCKRSQKRERKDMFFGKVISGGFFFPTERVRTPDQVVASTDVKGNVKQFYISFRHQIPVLHLCLT